MDSLNIASWRKSSYSGGSGTDCVEVGQAAACMLSVRDTKDRDGLTLSIDVGAWARFADSLR
jgi:Domain of unknown function (DUF397)